MKTPEKLVHLIRESEIKTNPGVDDRILQDARNELAKRRQDRNEPIGVLWRTLMKSKKTTFVTASLIVIVALIVFQFVGNPVGTNLTFAQVIEPILKADAIAFDFYSGGKDGNAPVRHVVAIASRIRETYDGNDYIVNISDFKEGRQLLLDKKKMEARYIAIPGFEHAGNLLETLKSGILMMKSTPGITVAELGLKRIDGHDAVGFFVHHPKSALYPNFDLTIWADVDTELPVRIEGNVEELELREVFWNIEFDIQMDEKLFSMEVPAGYTLVGELMMDARVGTEEKFINGLKVLAEAVNEDEFTFCESLDGVYKWVEDHFEKFEAMNVSEEEKGTIRQRYADVMSFIYFISRHGKWTYRGQGVKVGEADTPIFWYRPEGSETYRIIYGDLHVEDVSPDSLPQ